MAGCRADSDPRRKPEVRIVALAGRTWLDALAKIYASKLYDVNFSTFEGSGGVTNMDFVQNGRAEIGMAQSDIAYFAFTSGTETDQHPHSKLRGMALLQMATMHLIIAPGVQYRSLSDLRGKRVGVGMHGSSTEVTVRTILPELGIPLSEIDLQRVPFSQIPRQLIEGNLDAGFVFDSYPSALAAPAIAANGGRLASIEGPATTKLREKYPFFRSVIIPAGAYGQNAEIQTLGIKSVMVCRDDMADELVYRMLDVFFHSVRELTSIQPSLRNINLNSAPATPIPLHPGAARFYRERELLK